MKFNLFFYLLKQSVRKSLEGAALGTVMFSIIALIAFAIVQEFPPLLVTEPILDTVISGTYGALLFLFWLYRFCCEK